MIPFSPKYKEKLSKDQRDYRLSVKITPVNGTQFELTNEHLWANTFKIEDATSQGGKFTIGAAVTSKFSVTINNINGEYDDIDFYNAVVVPSIGLNTGDGVEAFVLGYFRVNDPKYNGSTISITCLDRLADFDVSCETMNWPSPATLTAIINRCCSDCGITADTTTYPPIFNAYVVHDKPDLKSTTYADLISMAAQIGCSFAKMDRSGKLSFSWYALGDAIEIIGGYDGGTFKYDGKTYDPNKDEAELDGGTFRYDGKAEDPNKDESNVDGGTFSRDVPGDYRPRSTVHIISGIKSLDVSTDEVQVTGVKVTEEFEEKGPDAGGTEIKKATYTAGDVSSSDRYVVDISGNKFIQHHEFSTGVMQGQKIANDIYSALRYYPFRPFKASILNDASIEAGDVCVIMDRKNHSYAAFISNRSFTVGQYENISCDAESPMTKAATRYTQLMKALTAAEAEAQARLEQLKVLQESVVAQIEADRQAFNILVAGSLGGHTSTRTDAQGGTIYYFHDQPALENSTKVWKMTSNTFSATDNYQGDQTDWKTGMSVSGEALLHNLSADWIKAGSMSAGFITSGTMEANRIKGGTLTIGGLNDTNGVINVTNASGKVLVKLDKNGITLQNGMKIAYADISGTPSIPTKASDLSDYSTLITNDSIKTVNVTAQNLTAGHVAAENITGTTISGKTLSGGTVSGGTITGSQISSNKSIVQQTSNTDSSITLNNGVIEIARSPESMEISRNKIEFEDTAHWEYTHNPKIIAENSGYTDWSILHMQCDSVRWDQQTAFLSDNVLAKGTPYTGRATISVNRSSTGSKSSTALYILNGLVCSVDV
jgi:hypothetical protein